MAKGTPPGMDSSSSALIIVGVISAILFGIQWFWKFDSQKSARHQFSHNFAQGVYATVAAIAILAAGLLFIIERQWSPRLEVDLKTRAIMAPETKPATAILQALVAVRNYGRTEQTIRDVAIGVDSYVGSDLTTNQYGDLQTANLTSYVRPRENRLMPGELDLISIETAIPCSAKTVRVLVKVEQPPYGKAPEDGLKNIYERKALVPLARLCSGRSEAVETGFQSADLSFSGIR